MTGFAVKILITFSIVLIFGARGNMACSQTTDPVLLTDLAASFSQIGAAGMQGAAFNVAFRNLGLVKLPNIEDGEEVTDGVREAPNLWFQGTSLFESVKTGDFPNLGNTTNGFFLGLDSKLEHEHENLDVFWGGFLGYAVTRQNISPVKIYQNAPIIGARIAAFKDDLYVTATANVLNAWAKDHNPYGDDDFSNFLAGAAAQVGYMFHILEDDKLLVQPNITVAYSFIQTSDYTAATGAKINSTPIHLMTITPGVRIISDLPHGFQPYLGAYYNMFWANDAHFWANGTILPDVPVKNFWEYGVGVQKFFDERAIGFIQAMARSGGRTGVGMSFGLSWKL
jgi:outer membrane autotransporter protein